MQGRRVSPPGMHDTSLVYVVEDDPVIRQLVAEALVANGFRVGTAEHAQDFWRLMNEAEPDLIILDIMMPGEDGLSVCRKLATRTRAAIIIASARGEAMDKVLGLEIGADDYLAKPFNDRELIARVRAQLRRRTRLEELSARPTYVFEGLRLETATRRLFDSEDRLIDLTSGEFDMLVLFLKRAGTVLSRDEITDALRGRSYDVYDRSIDVQVSRLRRKLDRPDAEVSLIRTIRNGGYTLATQVEVVA